MRSIGLYVGVQLLWTGVSLATDFNVKECSVGFESSCVARLSGNAGDNGFNFCKAICMRPDKNKAFKPGDSEDFSLDDYKKLIDPKACGSHDKLVDALVNHCGCYGDDETGGLMSEIKCSIKLENLDKVAGSVTSTSNPIEYTKLYQTAQAAMTKSESSTTRVESDKSTSLKPSSVQEATKITRSTSGYGEETTASTQAHTTHMATTTQRTTTSMTEEDMVFSILPYSESDSPSETDKSTISHTTMHSKPKTTTSQSTEMTTHDSKKVSSEDMETTMHSKPKITTSQSTKMTTHESKKVSSENMETTMHYTAMKTTTAYVTLSQQPSSEEMGSTIPSSTQIRSTETIMPSGDHTQYPTFSATSRMSMKSTMPHGSVGKTSNEDTKYHTPTTTTMASMATSMRTSMSSSQIKESSSSGTGHVVSSHTKVAYTQNTTKDMSRGYTTTPVSYDRDETSTISERSSMEYTSEPEMMKTPSVYYSESAPETLSTGTGNEIKSSKTYMNSDETVTATTRSLSQVYMMPTKTMDMTPTTYPSKGYTTPGAYVSTTTQPTTAIHWVEQCPKDYEGKGEWPPGNCLEEAFGSKEGMKIADKICNLQCADFAHYEWPLDYEDTYHRVRAKCGSSAEMSKALAMGCGCLNYGWVGKCRPQCEPPVGYTTGMEMSTGIEGAKPTTPPSLMPPAEYTTSSMEETTAMMTISWKNTSYVTATTTLTKIVPYPSGTTIMEGNTATSNTLVQASTSVTRWITTTYTQAICREDRCPPLTFTTVMPYKETTATETAIAMSTEMTTPGTPFMTTIMQPSSGTPVTLAPTSWTTTTYISVPCSGCAATTITVTIPCPVTTLSTVTYATSNAATCTCGNQIPQCTTPPGPPQGINYDPRCNQWYLIKEGDSCDGIKTSLKTRPEIEFIQAWNGMQDTDDCLIFTGRWLCVGLLQYDADQEKYRVKSGPKATGYDSVEESPTDGYVMEPSSTVTYNTVATYRYLFR